MIDHVIITIIDAAAIRSFQQCLTDAFLRRLQCEDGTGPPIILTQLPEERYALSKESDNGWSPKLRLHEQLHKKMRVPSYVPPQGCQVEVNCWGVIRALIAGRAAVQAPFGGIWRGIFGTEVEQISDAGQAETSPAQDPAKNVEVVTAFGQNHWRAASLVRPMPSNVAVRHMPKGYFLTVINMDDLSEEI
jgi:hypothetical protein